MPTTARVDGRDDALLHRGVELLRDDGAEALVQALQLRLELVAGPDRIDEEEARHGAVPGEHREHGAQGHIGTVDGVGDAHHGSLHLAHQPVGGGPQQLQEERFLGREVEVDAALARLRLATHLVHAGLAIAAPAEDREGRIEDTLPPSRAAFLLHHPASLVRLPTRRSVLLATEE